jgi:hypothetical protein
MAGNAGLALVQYLHQLAHRQFKPKHEKYDSKPGRVGQSAHDGEQIDHLGTI